MTTQESFGSFTGLICIFILDIKQINKQQFYGYFTERKWIRTIENGRIFGDQTFRLCLSVSASLRT